MVVPLCLVRIRIIVSLPEHLLAFYPVLTTLSTQIVVDDELMDYELPSAHGMWKPPKAHDHEEKKPSTRWIHDSPRRRLLQAQSSSSLFVVRTSLSQTFAQPVDTAAAAKDADSQCFDSSKHKITFYCLFSMRSSFLD